MRSREGEDQEEREADEERERIAKEFAARARSGRVMTREEVRALAKKRGVPWSEASYARMLGGFPGLQKYWEPRGRPRFQTVLRSSGYGTVFIDLFFLGKPRANGGAVGFLLGAEASSGQLAAVPIRGKGLEEMQRAVRKLVDESVFDSVKTVLCDKESALLSPKFRSAMKKERGINMRYLSTRVKSFLAERYGKYVKTKLHALMEQNGTSRWVDFVRPLLSAHNSREVPGTRIKRKNVDDRNAQGVMEKRLRVEDFDDLLSVSTVSDSSIKNDDWLDALFKLDREEKVRILRSAVPGATAFSKPSRTGYFTDELYRVVDRKLATTRDLAVIPGEQNGQVGEEENGGKGGGVSVYKVRNDAGGPILSGHFYERELLPAATREEEVERKRKAAKRSNEEEKKKKRKR